MNVGFATLTIIPSAKGFAAALGAETTDPLKTAGEDGGRKMGGGILSTLKGLLGPAMALIGVGAITAFVSGAINSAGALEQSIGAVDVIFADSAGQMHEWAKGAAQSAGLSENTYNELAGSMGTALKNMGVPLDQVGGKTNDLVTKGADLSAMFGGTAKEAVEALGSGLRGEYEPLRRYGISLSESAITAEAAALGFDTAGGSITGAAKEAAIASIIARQSADATGAFARESDTLSGKQQRLGATMENFATSLGTSVLPAVSGFVGMLADVMPPVLAAVKGAVDGVVVGLTAFGNWFTANLPWISQVAILIGSMVGALLLYNAAMAVVRIATAAWAAIQLILNIAMTANPIGLIVMAIGLLIGAIILLVMNWDTVVGFLASVWGAVVDWLVATFQTVMAWWNDLWTTVWEFIVEVWGNVMSFLGTVWQGILDAVGAFIDWVVDMFMHWTVYGIIISNWDAIVAFLAGIWTAIVDGVAGAIEGVVQWFTDLYSKVTGAVAGVGEWLVDAGRDLIQGFIDGITAMIGSVGDAIGGVMDFVGGFFPHSPAKRGPFSGTGWRAVTTAGLAIGDAFGDGLRSSDAMADPFGALVPRSPKVTSSASLGLESTSAGSSGSGDGLTVNLHAVPSDEDLRKIKRSLKGRRK